MADRAAGRRAPPRARRGWRRASRTALAAVLAALTAGAAGCGGEPGEDLPQEVLGTWTTGRAPYDGRSFRIARDSIYFETMEGFFEGYPIEGVDISTDEGRLLFTVEYRSPADREYDFSFYYDTPGGGQIRFKNRQTVPWDKAAADSSARTRRDESAGRAGGRTGQDGGSAGS